MAIQPQFCVDSFLNDASSANAAFASFSSATTVNHGTIDHPPDFDPVRVRESGLSSSTVFRKLINKTPLTGKEGDYLVDRLAEEAENFIRGNADTPFFLMLSHYAVHAPLQGQRDKTA